MKPAKGLSEALRYYLSITHELVLTYSTCLVARQRPDSRYQSRGHEAR